MKSRKGYWIGGALIVLAFFGAIGFAVASGASFVNKVDDFERIAVDEQRTLQLQARKYVVYAEAEGADLVAPTLLIEVQDANGESLNIENYSGSLTYAFGDQEGSAQSTFTPPRAGAYEVRVEGAPGTSVALGESVGPALVRTIVGTILIGGVFGLTGIVLLIVTGVRRSRHRAAAR